MVSRDSFVEILNTALKSQSIFTPIEFLHGMILQEGGLKKHADMAGISVAKLMNYLENPDEMSWVVFRKLLANLGYGLRLEYKGTSESV